ncbi:hypothetical protein [Stieleria varia]|uniref:Uncharacterized protein n=1 Tax=Stieleria varia TaxID=2528005 RepID=A0A5C6B2K7_9BACT|nr:hypothetical protein [Stieleria varia]TWU06057.1 hypothetical protein Pla52n_17760 [Stieleria varia]
MNVNFFEWLRNGVKQSVLLGVGDAVEQMGVPPNEEELQPVLASLMDASDSDAKGKRKTTGAGRKRLGKSLKDMDTSGAT